MSHSRGRRLAVVAACCLLLTQAAAARADEPTASPEQDEAGRGDWLTYRNAQAGFAVGYPASWTVDEHAPSDGRLVATFTPPDGRPGVVVSATGRTEGAGLAGLLDGPNQRCQAVSVAQLPAWHCVETLSAALVTTVTAGGETFMLAAPGQRGDPAVYAGMVDSFQLVDDAAGDAAPTIPSSPTAPGSSRFADAGPPPPSPPPPPPQGTCDGGCAAPPPGCLIKGTVPWDGVKIFWVPGQPGYADVAVDTSRGERWFCTIGEAVAAGWIRGKLPPLPARTHGAAA